MDIPALFEKMLVLFLIVLAGFVCGKTGVMSEQTNRSLSKLIANFTNPMLVLSSVMTEERLMSNREVLELSLIAVGCYAFLIAASFLIPKILHIQQAERGLYRFMFIFSNVGFLGYPLVRALFGEGAMFHMTVFVLFFQLLCWSYGAQTIAGTGRFRVTWRMLLVPGISSSLLAYVIYLADIPVPGMIADAVTMTGEITSPLAMLIIGCALSQCPARKVFGCWRLYALAAIKMIVVPVAAFFLLRMFVHDELLLGITVIVLAMPAATNATIISYEQHADDKLAASGVFLTTLLAVATVPGLMLLLFG